MAQCEFEVVARGDRRVLGGDEHWIRQRSAVELAVRRGGDLVEFHDHRRDHELGQCPSECAADVDRVGGCSARRRDVADEHGIACSRIHADDHHGLADASGGGQRCLDLAEFDALTADLHLEVAAPDVVESAVCTPPDEVARAVHPSTRLMGIGHEPIGRQVRASDVSTGQLGSGQVQFADCADRLGAKLLVEYIHRGVPHRATDRYGGAGARGAVVLEGDVDGGFGGTVEIVDRSIADAAEPHSSRRGEGLATGEDQPQVVEPIATVCGLRIGLERGDEGREHRRNEVSDRHGMCRHDVAQVPRIPMSVRGGHDEMRAGHQRPEELPHRYVEGGRGLLDDTVVLVDVIFVLHPLQPVCDRSMTDGDALGFTG